MAKASSRKKVSRTPVKGQRVKSPASKQAKVKIHKDPQQEFAKAVSKKGIVQILRMTDDDCLIHVRDYLSTGCLELDRMLGGRGLPMGRITEIFGPHHIGKSTLLDHLFRSVQKAGGYGVLADTEEARDINYTARIGVDVDKLMLLEFDRAELTMENVLNKILESIDWWRTNYPDCPVLIGWDSLGGTQTNEERDKDVERGKSPGSAASIMQLMRRKITPALANTRITLVILNHEYEKIRMAGGGAWAGKKRETYGGEAIRMAASVRMELHSVGNWLKDSAGVVIGREVGCKLVKTKVGVGSMHACRFALVNGVGVSNVWALFHAFKDRGIITTNGSWAAINLDGEVINFQGWNGLQKMCEEREGLEDKLVSVYNGLGA
jgi:recombination protein RecA